MAGADPLGELLLGQPELAPAQDHLAGDRLEGIKAGTLALVLGAAGATTPTVADAVSDGALGRAGARAGHGSPWIGQQLTRLDKC